MTTKTVKVDVGAPHSNYFAGVVGQPTWQVSVTATALAGIASKYSGVAPIIFSQEAFDPTTGLPFQPYTVQTDFTHTQGQGSDSPLTSLNVAWTNLGYRECVDQGCQGRARRFGADQCRPDPERLHRPEQQRAPQRASSIPIRSQA